MYISEQVSVEARQLIDSLTIQKKYLSEHLQKWFRTDRVAAGIELLNRVYPLAERSAPTTIPLFELEVVVDVRIPNAVVNAFQMEDTLALSKGNHFVPKAQFMTQLHELNSTVTALVVKYSM